MLDDDQPSISTFLGLYRQLRTILFLANHDNKLPSRRVAGAAADRRKRVGFDQQSKPCLPVFLDGSHNIDFAERCSHAMKLDAVGAMPVRAYLLR
jgi:hypothetical protein